MYRLWAAGWKLSAEGASSLEARLLEDPEDLDARITLVGYYSRHQERRLVAHGVWFVDHHPALEVWPLVDVFADELSQAWQRVLAQRPDDVKVLANASVYFARGDRAMAASLLQRGSDLEPSLAHWHASLARVGVTPLPELGLAIALAASAEERFGYLLEAAEVALSARDRILGTFYAERVLELAPTVAGAWNHGDGVHHAQIILGKLALAAGDLEGAKARLLASTDVPASSQVSPDQTLAAALLERGERDAVLAYVDACRAFGASFGELGALHRDAPPQLRVVK